METRSAVAEVLDIDNYLDWSGQVKTYYLTAQDLGDIFYPNIGKCGKYFLEINYKLNIAMAEISLHFHFL